MDGSFYSKLAEVMPPELMVLFMCAILALVLYHLRECSKRRQAMYERMGKSERLLHRIAGKLGVDVPDD